MQVASRSVTYYFPLGFVYIVTELSKSGSIHVKSTAVFQPTLFSFSKLLVVVLGPVSVEELVSVEDALSAQFAHYVMTLNILKRSWFLV